MDNIDEKLKSEKSKLKQLRQMKLDAQVKDLYVIQAGAHINDFYRKIVRTFYVNVPEFLSKSTDDRTSGDDFNQTVDESWPPYSSFTLSSATDASGALQYRDFLFTKPEAMKFAENSPMPKMILAGIKPANEACRGFDFYAN